MGRFSREWADFAIAITLDTYSHVTPGLQEAAANSFDIAVLKNIYLNKATELMPKGVNDAVSTRM